MAHFAELNADSIVQRVVVINNSDIIDEDGQESEALGISFCKNLYGNNTEWRQTSYNATFRKNYAGTGYKYDSVLDAFIAPQPYASWHLNSNTCQWEAPIPYPNQGGPYSWDESLLRWVSA